jgi:hypothetical protein
MVRASAADRPRHPVNEFSAPRVIRIAPHDFLSRRRNIH